MIPAAFDYVRAASTSHALELLELHGGSARLLSGGHSLLPDLKLRRAHAEVLVDISRIAEQRTIGVQDGVISIGAGVSHREIESSDTVRELAPLLAHAASTIGDRQVRARGTIGGSIAQSSRAGDLPTALTVLDASVVISSPAGERVVAIGDFFTGDERNVLEPFDVLTRIDVPTSAGLPWEYRKFTRRHQEWGVVLVAALGGAEPRVALGNMNPVPVRARQTEAALRDGATAHDAAQLVDDGCEVPDDAAAASDYRRHIARTLTQRSLTALTT